MIMSIVADRAIGLVGPGSAVIGGSFRGAEATSADFDEVATRLHGKSRSPGSKTFFLTNLSDAHWRGELAAAPWWLWWNILSLDAPLVACVWAEMFAWCAGIRVPASELGALFLSVWLIYTVDRLLDSKSAEDERQVGAFGGAFGSALRQRHIFHAVHRKGIACAAVAAAVCAGLLALRQLNAGTFAAGFVMLCVVGGYMAWIHAGKVWKIGVARKEFAVGMIFAAGASLPVRSRFAWSTFDAMGAQLLEAVVLFGAVCWLNCVAIDAWERPRDDGDARRGILHASRWVLILACGIVACGVAAMIAGGAGRGFLALAANVACSAVLIAILDLMRERLSAESLRVFVDLALIVPAVAAMVVPFSR
jgi:hypothetical protein